MAKTKQNNNANTLNYEWFLVGERQKKGHSTAAGDSLLGKEENRRMKWQKNAALFKTNCHDNTSGSTSDNMQKLGSISQDEHHRAMIKTTALF